MNKFLQLLTAKTGSEWIASSLTIYADDIHAGSDFRNIHEFQVAIRNFGHILDTLEEMRLQLSYSKSFVVLATAGTNCQKGLKGHVTRTPQGANLWIPRAHGTKSSLPLRQTGKYLGVELGYRKFEETTWQLRKRAAWSAFVRLKAWFRSRCIGKAHRLHLWRQCVHTILTYGVFATSMTGQVIHDYQATVFRMLRLVLQDHAYITCHTHQQALAFHSIDHPLVLLERTAMGLWTRLLRRASTLPTHDFLYQVDWSHLPELIRLIRNMHADTVQVPVHPDVDATVTTQAPIRCSQCDFVTHTVPNLRRHMTKVHAHVQFRSSHVPPIRLAKNGHPQCSLCHTSFTTWRSFFIHVERDCCQASICGPVAHPAPRLPPSGQQPAVASVEQMPALSQLEDFHVAQQPFWPGLQAAVNARTWNALVNLSQVGEFLTHTCQVCGLWVNRCQELHAHYRLHHSQLLPGTLAKSAQITKGLAHCSPCPLCQRTFKHGHCCPVATQVAALYIHLLSPMPSEQNARTCDLCPHTFDNMAQLHQHLQQAHALQVHDWCPSRDALEHSDACAHCGQLFETRAGLRRHILDGACPSFDP